MSELILQTRNLSKRYKKRWAVDGLNLEVRRGDVFGFLGPNGAGKSTTIRMLLSLIRPTTGEVTLFEKTLRGHRSDVLSRVGGLVERADFYLYLSARKNLEIVSSLRGNTRSSASTIKKEIDEVLDIAGLHARANDRVKTYSHGMKQRLGIAQALLGNPEFIILDEPTTGLDPQGIKEVRELIRRLSTEKQMTIFLSSHLLSEIEQTATSMAIINRGKMVVQGKVHELLNRHESIVKIAAQPMDRARVIIGEQAYVKKVETENLLFHVHMSQEDVGTLNAKLVAEGIVVNMLAPQTSLEEYFLTITENSSDIS